MTTTPPLPRPGRAFTDWFYERYQRAHKMPPAPAVWTFKKCDTLSQALSLEELKRRGENYFQDPFLKVHSLEKFISAPDAWAERRVSGFPSKIDERVANDRKRTAL